MMMKRGIRWVWVAGWVLCTGPVGVLAEGTPEGRRSAAAPVQVDALRDGAAARPRGARDRDFTPDEWANAEQWLKEYSPSRWAFFQKISEGRQREVLKQFIIRRMRGL